MKVSIFLASATAALALGGCNKNSRPARPPPPPNDTVTITQANPPPGGTWADVVNATSAGFMMGNPNAKVKLVEIGSLFCPLCKRFEEEGVPTLIEKYVKTGQVSWEFRPYIIHGPVDMVANLIARCNGPKTFFPLSMRSTRTRRHCWRRSRRRRRTRSRRSRICRSTRSSSRWRT